MSNNDLDAIVKKYAMAARLKTIKQLTEEYKMDKETSFRVEQEIFTATRTELIEKYGFKEPFSTLEDAGVEKKPLLPLLTKYPDLIGFILTVMSIPLYQSLGDTFGYKNGDWEFNYGEIDAPPEYANKLIYEFISLGGINDMSIVNLMASDDTVLYLDTCKILTEKISSIDDFGRSLQKIYIDSLKNMENRAAGVTTIQNLEIQKYIEWNKLPYNSKEIGNGSVMRAGCIGIFFPGKHNRKKLIALAVECSRITHNSAVAILGCVTTALFTAFSLEKIPIAYWPHKLLKIFKSNKIDEYMQSSRPNDFSQYTRDKILYIGKWEKYVRFRFSGLTPKNDIYFMENPVERFAYLTKNFSIGCGVRGGCADDCLIMAYDALFQSGNVIEKLLVYSILHPGDSDTIGSIAFSWFGAYYHSPKNQRILSDRFDELEFQQEINDLFKKKLNKIIKIFFNDIYQDVSKKYLNQIKKKSN